MSTENASPEPRLMTWGLAADYLATSTRHLRRLVAERRIGFIRVGGLIRFEREALDAYVAANRVGAVR